MPVSQSTMTQLDAINEAIRNIGERPFQLDDPVTNFRALCQYAVKTALMNFARDFDWTFMRRYTPAASWLDAEATLPPYTRLQYVDYRPPNLNDYSYRLMELRLDEFRSYVKTPLGISAPTIYPHYYTQQDAESILVHPYPVTVDERSRLYFSYFAELKVPVDDTDNFDIPDTHMPLFVRKLSAELATVHLSDPESISIQESAYRRDLQLSISRNQNSTVRKPNLYRGKRNASYGWQ